MCIVLGGSILGCQKQDPIEVKILKWVEKADPKTDAQIALSKGDHRLRAVYGLTVTIPGTDPKDFQSYKQNYGTNEIEGTTDARMNGEHGRLIIKAREYAEAYNLYILREYKPENRP
ncbi:hypothetical protein [Geothrix campi]|uniref:hypothetical protein n=1 Tax=Geothrix campi TaxID=2966450 RepID=UPI002147C4B1|nr:hypothetical protein [Geothrix sp. SG10]